MYTIIRETAFDEQMQILAEDYERMSDLDNAIDWALARNPTLIPNALFMPPHFFLWVTEEFYEIRIPEVRILYRVESETNAVYLMSIAERIPENEPVFF